MTTKRNPVDYAKQVEERRRRAQEQGTVPPQGAPGGSAPGAAVVPGPSAATSEANRAREEVRSTAPPRQNGVSADRPIVKPKVDRQGIDLRPLDRERWERMEMFCLQRRLKLGKKKGLTLYARAGLQLLDELLAKDETAVEALLRSLGEKPTT